MTDAAASTVARGLRGPGRDRVLGPVAHSRSVLFIDRHALANPSQEFP